MAIRSVFRCTALFVCLLPSVQADDLLSLLLDAQISNPNLLSAAAGNVVGQAGKDIALGQLLPNLSLSGSMTQNSADRQTGNTPKEHFGYGSQSYNLSLRQPIFRKYNLALYDQSRAQSEAAEADFKLASNALAVSLTEAYMNALYADDQLSLLEAQRASTAAQLEAAKKAQAVGSGTRIDVDDAQAKYDLILAQVSEAKNQQQHTRRQLGAYVNREIRDLAGLDVNKFSPLPPQPLNVDDWLTAANAHSPSYLAQQAQLKAAGFEVDKAQAGHFPALDLVANIGSASNDSLSSLSSSGDSTYDTRSLGVQLTIPLFAGGQVNATVRQAKAREEQQRQRTEDARRNLMVETRREYDNLTQGIETIRALEKAELSGQKSIASAKKGITAGVRTMLDVLQAEQAYFNAKKNLAQARYRYLISDLKLKALAGRLTVGDVEALNLQLKGGQKIVSPAETSEPKPATPVLVASVMPLTADRPVASKLAEPAPAKKPALPVVPVVVENDSPRPNAVILSRVGTQPPAPPAMPVLPAEKSLALAASTATILPAPAPAPAPAPGALNRPVMVAKGIFVQLGAFSSQENAAALRESVLQAQVVPADQLQQAFVDKLYRVYVGPYGSRDLAEAMRGRLTAALGSRAVLVVR